MGGRENTLGSFWDHLGKETQAPAAHVAGLGLQGPRELPGQGFRAPLLLSPDRRHRPGGLQGPQASPL